MHFRSPVLKILIFVHGTNIVAYQFVTKFHILSTVPYEFQVDGKSVNLPYKLDGKFEIHHTYNMMASLTTVFGLQVSFDGRSKAKVRVPGAYRNQLCGICGNCNGNAGDDLKLQDGTDVSDVRPQSRQHRQIGDSYLVQDSSSR